jgi:hypothetical protein
MATDNLTSKQEKAVAALLSNPTIKQAAEACGIGERTLHSWLDTLEFQRAYSKARREAVQQATARLQQYSSLAVTTLLEIMATKTNPAAVRLTAAKAVLEMAFRSVELEDLELRLAALEAKAHEK